MKVYMVMEDDVEYGYALLCTGQVYSSKEAAEAAKAELDKVAPTTSDERFVREFDVLEGVDAAKAVDVAEDGRRTVTIEVAY